MKEAAGEANMTVITIILIGVIAAVAIPLVSNAMKTTEARSHCTNQGMSYVSGKCNDGDCSAVVCEDGD